MRVLCLTPDEHCTGGKLVTDQQLKKKCHTSHKEAFKCTRRYMIRVLGYTRPLNATSTRDLQNPVTGYVEILTKPSRFGSELRFGKEKSRWMPKHGGAGVVIG